MTSLGIDRSQVIAKYKELSLDDQREDRWHRYSDDILERELNKFFRSQDICRESKILNAGSGGREYSVYPRQQVHVDLVPRNISRMRSAALANIEILPIKSSTMDHCICVGSVVNYCDAALVIAEIGRVLKIGGLFALEFENSRNPQFMHTTAFNASASIVKTFGVGGPENLWVYSEQYINSILRANRFVILRTKRYHIMSCFAYALIRSVDIAARFSVLDPIMRLLPLVGKLSANSIIFCRRMS